MRPGSPLTEPLVVRPTSETIIGASYARWVQSYRDLPILINQWANVVRWEMRPRLFLRTTEFLWQEGHTVHETESEARGEATLILELYARFVRDHLAVPVFTGAKSESEKFPGAVETLALEAMVQDRKAIQAGTSHFLGQNFARASGIQFQTREGKQEFGWTTSWGMTTALFCRLASRRRTSLFCQSQARKIRVRKFWKPATGSPRSCVRKNFSMMLGLRLKSIGAIWAAELRIGSGSRKVYRCELRSGRVISRTIRSL